MCKLFQELKQEWVAIPEPVMYNLIQSTAWEMLDSYWLLPIPEEDTPPIDVRVPKSQHTEWWNYFFDEKSVNVMNFDLNQLQNEILWTYF